MRVRHGRAAAVLVPSVIVMTIMTFARLTGQLRLRLPVDLDWNNSSRAELIALAAPNEAVGPAIHTVAERFSTALLPVVDEIPTVTSMGTMQHDLPPIMVSTHLWIHVQEFSEGMATWRRSLAEILLVAKRLNATVVEPCIGMGRLQSCNQATYRLSQMYDLERLRLWHPYIIPYEIYSNLTMVTGRHKPNMVPMCHQSPEGSPPVMVVCGTNTPNMYQMPRNDVLEKALQNNNASTTTVIDIKYYRRGGFAKTQIDGVELISDTMVTAALSAHFEFQRHHYDTVDQRLQLMGINNDTAFDVIHWRAELPNINHNECATKILRTKQILGSNQTVLISSIHTNSFFQWYIPYRHTQAVQSLNRLLVDADFHKIDQVDQDYLIPDTVVLAIWDQIIALKARRFATCTKACRKKAVCRPCNYLGNYAQLAIDLRQNIGKTSDNCWPS